MTTGTATQTGQNPTAENGADTSTIARAIDLRKVYGKGQTQVTALDGVTVEFGRGQLTAIMGPSGSGKSTLMHCMAGLDKPSSGEVYIEKRSIGKLGESALTKLRRSQLGFVFQSFNLVPTLTARENIVLPLTIARKKPDPEWFDRVIEATGLRDRLRHRPVELSGGQQQRVACARALITRPSIVFADEPTGNLDSTSSQEVLGFLRTSVDEFGQSIVIVTHDPTTAAYADRVLFLADGKIVGDLDHPSEDVIIDQLRVHTARVRAGAAGTVGEVGGTDAADASASAVGDGSLHPHAQHAGNAPHAEATDSAPHSAGHAAHALPTEK